VKQSIMKEEVGGKGQIEVLGRILIIESLNHIWIIFGLYLNRIESC